MRETTESIAKRRACGVSTESVDMLFAPRKLRVRGNGKYFIDRWAGGVNRIVVASTGRIVAVFEDFRDAHRTKNLLNNDSSERKSKAEMERLREQIKCGHSMELDALARERDELLVENERLKDAQFKRLEREAEKRMELRTALAAAEADNALLRNALEDSISWHDDSGRYLPAFDSIEEASSIYGFSGTSDNTAQAEKAKGSNKPPTHGQVVTEK